MMQTGDKKNQSDAQMQDTCNNSFGGMRCRLAYDAYEAQQHAANGKKKRSHGTFWTVLLFCAVVALVSVGIILLGILFMKGAADEAESGRITGNVSYDREYIPEKR